MKVSTMVNTLIIQNNTLRVLQSVLSARNLIITDQMAAIANNTIATEIPIIYADAVIINVFYVLFCDLIRMLFAVSHEESINCLAFGVYFLQCVAYSLLKTIVAGP